MAKRNLDSIQVYLTKTQMKKIDARRRKLGYFSNSDYGRDLFRADLKK